MSLIGPFGERVELALPLAPDIARELYRIQPPAPAPFGGTFNQVVSVLKRKEFRKWLFTQEAGRLGALLAERMEDAEGWHDIERVEPARKQLGWKP